MSDKIRVSFKIEIPDGCNMRDIQQWLEFELGANCSMDLSKDSPLRDEDLEALSNSIDFDCI